MLPGYQAEPLWKGLPRKAIYSPAGAGAIQQSLESRLRKSPHPSDYTTNAQYLSAVQALATNQHFTQNGALIWRVPDRMFGGNAIDNDGTFPNVSKDWLTTWQSTLATKRVIGVARSGVTTSGSPIVTFTAGGSTPSVGAQFFGDFCIPDGATVQSVDSPTQITLSANATGNSTTNTFYSNNTTMLGGVGVSASLFWLTNQNKSSAYAAAFGAHSQYFTSAGASCIGLVAMAVNDNATLATNAWAYYGEAHRKSSTVGSTYGMELNVLSTAASETTPNSFRHGTTGVLQLAAGCGLAGVLPSGTQVDISNAIGLWPNPRRFKVGIVVGASAIVGTDGVTVTTAAPVLSMAAGHAFQWRNVSEALTAQILSTNTDSTAKTELRFMSSGVQILGDAGQALMLVQHVASAVNYIQAIAGTTGNPASILAAGTDANIDLRLRTTGTGVLRFGTHTATGDVVCNGHITVKDDAGNTRKLMTTA